MPRTLSLRPRIRRKALMSVIAAAIGAAAMPSLAASIAITNLSTSFSENFNSLTRSTTAENWTDNAATVSANDPPRVIGLPGWFVGNFGTTTVTPQIRAGTGSSTTGSFYSFGATSDPDRALGTLPTDSSASASMRIGVRFVNESSSVVSGFSFSYDGEQWRKAQLTTATNNQYVVAYGVFPSGGGSLNGTFTTINSAEFNTPVDGGDNVGAALDGNDPANRVAGLNGSISGLSVQSGEEIWLRWFDANSSGADQGIAIDNFAITFTVPEPSGALVLFGAGLTFLTRRRSQE